VVIIGGGAVGVSALYHLALKGWTDCLLLERNELTSGSTWHAAGNVPTFSTSWSLMHMQRYSAGLYRSLAEAVGYPMNYHVTGSIRLAHTEDRMAEFARAAGMGRYQGMEIGLITPVEIKAKYPFIETHDLKGALFDPSDGDIDPAQLTQALAKGARDLGAVIRRFCAVTGVSRKNRQWLVHTAEGEVTCEKVVNAAGYRAREVAEFFRPHGGRRLPMAVMSHQYLVFDEVPELRDWSAAHGRKLPLLRDVDTSYYLRQEKNGFNLGPYERTCRSHWTGPADPMPQDFAFQLFPDDLERLEPYIADAMARVPLLAGAGLARVINGPIPYAPDGNPLIGPMPGVPDAYEACVFTFGIAQAGGAGKVLAEWVTEGATEWDMWSCDPRRFTAFADDAYAEVKAREIYGHEYAVAFPRHDWPAGRDRRLSPVHAQVKARGAVFGAYNGWERAQWYAAPGDDIAEAASLTFRRDGPWARAVRAECEAVRDAAGLLDLPGFSRYRLEGKGAADWLAARCTGRLPAVGRIGLLYFADHRGRIVTEMSAMRIAEDFFFLITASVAEWHDLELLSGSLPRGLDLRNVSAEFTCQILTGPRSRAILATLTDADLGQPWLSHQSARVAGHWCQLVRVSFAGELGWEVHSKTADTAAIYEALSAAGRPFGLTPFGMYALDSLRLEKGYRTWKGDLSSDYTLLQAGLGRFIDWTKPAFPGKAALEAERKQGPARRFATLLIEAGDCDAHSMANVWQDDRIVGEVTSGGWGYRIGRSIGLSILRADCARPGNRLEVEIYGQRCPALVAPEGALWDPRNERLKV
jgi:dimethylglycine dehydrogenase